MARRGADEIRNLSAKGRYVRIECLRRGTEHGFSLWGAEILQE
jgi:hypothetical protein